MELGTLTPERKHRTDRSQVTEAVEATTETEGGVREAFTKNSECVTSSTRPDAYTPCSRNFTSRPACERSRSMSRSVWFQVRAGRGEGPGGRAWRPWTRRVKCCAAPASFRRVSKSSAVAARAAIASHFASQEWLG
eukprot:tig00000403_g270.t1